MLINTYFDYLSSINRLSEAEILKNFTDKYINKYPIIITCDFNSFNDTYEKRKDAIPWLVSKGFILSSTETNDTLHHRTQRQTDYYKGLNWRCEERGYHVNKKNLTEQKDCDEQCDIECGSVVDYCLRANTSNVKFTKYMVLID